MPPVGGALTLDLCQPFRLVVVLRSTEGRVEEDEQQNQPVEGYRFDSRAAVPAADAVPAAQRPTVAQIDMSTFQRHSSAGRLQV